MDAMASSSIGRVVLDFEEGYDLNEKLNEVTNRVATIQTFPPDAERPQISLRTNSERVITIVLSGDLTEKDLKLMGEQIRDEVANLPAVSSPRSRRFVPTRLRLRYPSDPFANSG